MFQTRISIQKVSPHREKSFPLHRQILRRKESTWVVWEEAVCRLDLNEAQQLLCELDQVAKVFELVKEEQPLEEPFIHRCRLAALQRDSDVCDEQPETVLLYLAYHVHPSEQLYSESACPVLRVRIETPKPDYRKKLFGQDEYVLPYQPVVELTEHGTPHVAEYKPPPLPLLKPVEVCLSVALQP